MSLINRRRPTSAKTTALSRLFGRIMPARQPAILHQAGLLKGRPVHESGRLTASLLDL